MNELLLQKINTYVCTKLGYPPDVLPCISTTNAAQAISISPRCLADLRRRDRVRYHRAAGRIWYPIAGLIYSIDYFFLAPFSVPLTQVKHHRTTLDMKAIDALMEKIPLFVIVEGPLKIAHDKKGAAKAISCSERSLDRMLADGRLSSSSLCAGKVLIPHWSVVKALEMTTS